MGKEYKGDIEVMGEKSFFSLVFGAMLLFSGEGLALSAHSKHLLELQSEFQNASSLHTIVYIDREVLRERMQGEDLDVQKTEDQKVRNKYIAQFVWERIGVRLDDISADAIGDYYSAGMNVAVPTEVRETGEAICAVLGADPETTAREEAERFLYWDHMKDHTPEYEGKEIDKLLTDREFHLMADMHETFHCMDPYYMVKQKSGTYENEPTVHRAESYAEVGALLYLAGKKGLTQVSETRALYRIVGSFMVGRYGEELLGPNLFAGINFGVVYSFYPAMFATQEVIDGGLGVMGLEDIQRLAHSIVEENAVVDAHAHAMTQYQARPDNLQQMIEDFRDDDNEYFRNRFRAVEKHRDEYVEVLDWAFAELFRPETAE